MSTPPRVPRVLTELARRRTWNDLGYAVLGLAYGIAGFTVTVTTLSISAGLLVTFVGLPFLTASGLACRWIASGIRRRSNALTGARVPAPGPLRRGTGVLGWVVGGLTDAAAWRARLYLLLKLPLGIASFTVAVTFWSVALAGITYATWRPFLPCQDGADGRCHTGASFGPHYFLDTPARIALAFLLGVIVALAAPWAVRAVLAVDHALVRGLLGPTHQGARVAELERSRATAVDDSAATLRRIERDLHDGAQARMVAVAMTVGLAREKLAEGSDPAEASALLDSAHTSAKAAIVELRDLARGIHPPVLDTGLGPALETLATHSAVPVDLTIDIHGRQDPAIETMAYFCVAELLTNVAKHSGASRVTVDVRTSGPWLRLLVGDDGRGGARLDRGSGLAGLADRVATVDGNLTVTSPDGGPTLVTVDVPLRTGAGA